MTDEHVIAIMAAIIWASPDCHGTSDAVDKALELQKAVRAAVPKREHVV